MYLVTVRLWPQDIFERVNMKQHTGTESDVGWQMNTHIEVYV